MESELHKTRKGQTHAPLFCLLIGISSVTNRCSWFLNTSLSLYLYECVLYLEFISNNLWLASVVSLQLPHDNHVLILGLAIK